MGVAELYLIIFIYLLGFGMAYFMARNVINPNTKRRSFSLSKVIVISFFSWFGFIFIWLKYAEPLWDD